MSENTKISQLIGKDLKGFKIVQMFEVYESDVDGKKVNSRGLFNNSSFADVYIDLSPDPTYLRAKSVIVLTDGNVGYLVEDQEMLKIIDDESGINELKKLAKAKLSPSIRKLLGLE